MSSLNTAMLLEFAARQVPEKIFLLDAGQPYTYNQVDIEAAKVAAALAGLGIAAGDHVALLLPNVAYFPICLFGCFKLGAVPVLLNVTAPGPEIAACLEASHAVVLIAADALSQPASEGFDAVATCRHLIMAGDSDPRQGPAESRRLSELTTEAGDRFETRYTDADAPAAMLFTSGTTGHPKGIIHSHSNYYYIAQFSARDFWQLGPEDIILMVAPGSSIFGQSMLTSACVAGAAVSLLPRFHPEAFLQTIQDYRVTFFAGVPTLVHFMLNSPW